MTSVVRLCAAVLLAAALALASAGAALAAKPAVKLTRGVTNLYSGWLDVPNQMAREKKEGSSAPWVISGLFRGLAEGGRRTLLGVWDIVTFPIPTPAYDRPAMDPPTLISEKEPRDTSLPEEPEEPEEFEAER